MQKTLFMHFHFWQLAVIEDSDSFRESFCAIFLFNNSLRQHCGGNFCRLQCNFNTRQSSLWVRPHCRGVLSRFSTKLPPIAQLLRAKGKKERKMIYWRKGTSGKKFVRTRFADESTRQVFQSGSLCPIPEELENGLSRRKKERELGSEEWRKRWVVRKWEGRGDRECTEECFCIDSNRHHKHYLVLQQESSVATTETRIGIILILSDRGFYI